MGHRTQPTEERAVFSPKAIMESLIFLLSSFLIFYCGASHSFSAALQISFHQYFPFFLL